MQDKGKTLRPPASPQPAEDLPYFVELWRDGDHSAVERLLGRALNAQLARAIFKAAKGEHPERRITLRKANRIIEDTTS
jgi:hypothetical protein